MDAVLSFAELRQRHGDKVQGIDAESIDGRGLRNQYTDEFKESIYEQRRQRVSGFSLSLSSEGVSGFSFSREE
ncbi:hypothetical protein BDD12DRAFT_873272 [Trichophaea hybrida]|nr:hypothetical protein BDD12DRAFT_873272 [Trichophaea hybrida]